MLTAKDLTKRLGLPLKTIAYMHAKKILPEPIKVGGECRWRVEDIELFEGYLLARREYRENGLDPDAEHGPGPPIYSMGQPRLDPREVVARINERARREKSRTLAAGTQSIPAEEFVRMPDAAEQTAKK